ncbi:hypothetical protein BKA62DRAFT_699275 [Auriculariales sp. MPI-PUGE-AT-0066]|nr:hypothetical protein BKA62DRAFT_699275 [Auriculariales sp. MPI-PUGE-AT-0066]
MSSLECNFDFDGILREPGTTIRHRGSTKMQDVAQYHNSPDQVEALNQDTLDAVCRILQQASLDHNSSQAVARLPAELLAQIFSYTALKERVQSAVVCKTWSQVLFNSPVIWTSVNFDPERFKSSQSFSKLLSFSGQSPIYLDLAVTPKHTESVCDSLSATMTRCTQLNVALDGRLRNSSAGRATRALCSPAPLLQAFWLYDNMELFNKNKRTSVRLFADNAPLLRRIKMQCDINAVRFSDAAMSQVTHVLFSQTSLCFRHHVVKLLNLFPAAEEMAFEVDSWGSSADDGGSGRLVPPERLRKLCIVCNRPDSDPMRFLGYIDWQQVPSVSVVYNIDSLAEDDGSIFSALCGSRADLFVVRALIAMCNHRGSGSRGPPVCMRWYMFDGNPEHVILPLPAGSRAESTEETSHFVRERMIVDVTPYAVPSPSLFVNVTALVLPDVAFVPELNFTRLPPLPALRDVSILVMNANWHRANQFLSPTSFSMLDVRPDEAPILLECPALQTIRIAARELYSTERETDLQVLTLCTPGMIVSFIRNHFAYTAERLATLYFNAVEIYVVDPMELHEMAQLATDVQYDKRRVSFLAPPLDLLTWN